ncbi:MAG: phosphatidate cytidylyltransferase [Alphaproteobacteria bacterium]|nr:phosphatidate cytidylyltransferase [Alphaproteobacteria bacterium]
MAETGRVLGLRVVSGVVLGVVGIAAAVAGGWAFTGLAAVAGIAMAYEWDRLNGGTGLGPMGVIHGAAVVVAAILVTLGHVPVPVMVILAAGVVTFVMAGDRDTPTSMHAAGVVYVSLAPISMIWLRSAPDVGLFAVLWIFAVVWATDTGAYFTGRALGGPKLAPSISPGKTWSGFFGGTAAAGLVGWFAASFMEGTAVAQIIAASLVVSVVGQIGDLLISKVKRVVGVKDTGTFIPGHGGVLDRLDSLLPTVPLVAVGVYVLQQRGVAWL